MKVIVGLGNPGAQYTLTRHNIGFLLIDYICHDLGLSTVTKKFNSLIYSGLIDGEKCLFVKPQTFMNNSGMAVQSLMAYYKIHPKDFIIIFDDFELTYGSCRIRENGSAGTHNGMKSIIQQCNNKDFVRLRMGVGPLNTHMAVKDFVLQNFSKEQQGQFDVLLSSSYKIIKELVTGTVPKAMNLYNNKQFLEIESD